MKVAIIGGGISGLSTAFFLKQADKNIKIDLYEASDKLGGSMKTHHENGYLFEHGVNGFLSNKPDTLEFIKTAKAEHLLLKSNDLARIRFIYKDELHILPESIKTFLTTPLLSFAGKLRVLSEPFRETKLDDNDETLQSFGYRRVGKEMTDTFLDAMVAGVFASTPDKISVNSAFPLVVALEKEYGGLFKGMLKKRKKSAGPGGVLMSFKGGVSAFIEHLKAMGIAEIFLNTKVTSIEKIEDEYKVVQNSGYGFYDKVILATPSYISGDLVANFDLDLATKLKAIEYSPISVVGFGYDKLDHDLQGFGLLTTSSSYLDILGVLWDSSIFTDRAPKGKKCVRVMIGGQRNKELALKEKNELIRMAKKGIEITMGAIANPSQTFVKKYEKGIPNYSLGHQERIDELFLQLQSHKGLFLNSNAYKGIALNDCVKNSKECAKQVLI